jgi:hypothetical protein
LQAKVEAAEEVEHILRLIDAELKGTPEYAECKNDPKKALAAVFRARSTHEMPKKIVKDILNNLGNKLDAIFASLPCTRGLSLEHFYANKLRVLKMSEDTRKKLREKEVRGSASAEEAIKDD